MEARWALEALRAERAPSPQMALNDYAGPYGSVQVSVQDHALSLRNGRRPALALLPLAAEQFAIRDQASTRVRFERDASGRVMALEMLDSDGAVRRFPRKAP